MNYGDEGSQWDERDQNPETGDYGANVYEKQLLALEERKVQAAKVKKYNAKKACLELKNQQLELRAEIARENRLRAEAELKRTQELRGLRRDRHRVLKERRKVEELKQQNAQDMRRLNAAYQDAAERAFTAEERVLYLETGERMDPQTVEFLTCPKCGDRMGVIEFGCGRQCPSCLYVKEPD